MAHPVRRFESMRQVLFWIAFLLLVFPACATILFLALISLPYMLLNYSSNFGMSKKDMGAVQLYLDHFEVLHPELLSHVSRYFSSQAYRDSAQRNSPQSVRFWPTLSKDHDISGVPLIVLVHTTTYTFTCASGLFMHLEARGFPRRILWDFLQSQVETRLGSDLSESDRTKFDQVKEKICSNRWFDLFIRKGAGGNFTRPESTPLGIKVIEFRAKSVDWIVEPGALIVPMDWGSYRILCRSEGIPLWRIIKRDIDLEDGLESHWQLADCR